MCYEEKNIYRMMQMHVMGWGRATPLLYKTSEQIKKTGPFFLQTQLCPGAQPGEWNAD